MLREYLKRIADAIRAALGLPSDTTINAQDFPDKVVEVYESGFEAGKAAGGGGFKYTSGTVEFVDSANCTVYHNLGTMPRALYVWTEPTAERINACLGVTYDATMPITMYAVLEDRTTYTAPTHLAVWPQCIQELTDTYAKISGRNSNYPVLIGTTYHWLAIE